MVTWYELVTVRRVGLKISTTHVYPPVVWIDVTDVCVASTADTKTYGEGFASPGIYEIENDGDDTGWSFASFALIYCEVRLTHVHSSAAVVRYSKTFQYKSVLHLQISEGPCRHGDTCQLPEHARGTWLTIFFCKYNQQS